MDIEIDFNDDLRQTLAAQIDFIKEEFDLHFGNRSRFSPKDRELATQLLRYLSKIVDQPIGLDVLTETLESLEKKFPLLFVQ
jgi:hypothetical protein